MKKQNGITLIALVITIVVLLILAGVSINMVLGPNGILNNAKEAKTSTNDSSLKEYISTALMVVDTEASKEIPVEDSWYTDDTKGAKYFKDEIKNYGATDGDITTYSKDTTTGAITYSGTMVYNGKTYNWTSTNGAVTLTIDTTP